MWRRVFGRSSAAGIVALGATTFVMNRDVVATSIGMSKEGEEEEGYDHVCMRTNQPIVEHARLKQGKNEFLSSIARSELYVVFVRRSDSHHHTRFY